MLENELYTVVERKTNAVTVRMLPESKIYQAHFPGAPVTPGVCQVGMVQEQLEVTTGRRLSLREVKTLKFLDVLRPENGGDVVLQFDKVDEDGNLLSARGLVRVGERIYTKYSLIFEIL
jgi:3-hydroxyacyl-[acyl-carrier-protein] dehydratase